tara:strand:+ start:7234 stop:7686 length:453 start_codon:yes stop_codon:yes gene_type:complete
MGKKRVIQKSEKELLEESKQAAEKKVSVATSPKRGGMREGRIAIYSSYNNTLISLADLQGNVVFTVSAGSIGFKGTKKSTPFAASKVAEALAEAAKSKGVERIAITLKGIGPGRESALRSLGTKGFVIISIRDITPVPHNGPRRPKVRKP